MAGDQFYPREALSVTIVTPDEQVLSEPCDMAVIPGVEGYIGVMPGHTPMITALKPGVLYMYRHGELAWRIYVAGGFAEVNFGTCVVLAERANDLPDVDLATAEADIAACRAMMQQTDDAYELTKLEGRLQEAEARRAAAAGEFVLTA